MVTEIIRRIIDTTLAELGREATYDDYIRTAQRLYPEEMRKLADGFERQGFIKWLKSGMRQAANVDEADADAPTVQLDLLPGLAAPAYLDVGTDREPRLLRFIDALVSDLQLCIEKRRHVRALIRAREEDLQQKMEWLRANQRDASETVGQVCARLQGPNGPQPSRHDDRPSQGR